MADEQDLSFPRWLWAVVGVVVTGAATTAAVIAFRTNDGAGAVASSPTSRSADASAPVVPAAAVAKPASAPAVPQHDLGVTLAEAVRGWGDRFEVSRHEMLDGS